MVGTVVYKVVSEFDSGNTGATTKEGTTLTQYFRIAARDQGERAQAAQTVSIRTELNNLGTATLKFSGAATAPTIGTGNYANQIRYTMNATDAVNGVITIKITATGENKTNPKTGYDTPVELIEIICVIILCGATVLVARIRTRKKD
jgi:hypothetical protein